MSEVAGPFRDDARVERRAECAPPDVGMEAVARVAKVAWWFLGYLAVIAAGAVVSALALPGAGAAGSVAALGVLGFAGLIARTLRVGRTLTERQRASMPLRCAFTRDEIVLEGNAGRSAWRYEGVRGIVAAGPLLVVVLHGDSVLVLREGDDGGETLAAFLTRRAPALDVGGRVRQMRRRLAGLAAVYVAIVAGAALFARG